MVLLVGAAECSEAATIQAAPLNLPSRIAAARPGDTVKLAPGRYPNLTISGRAFSPALVIEAKDATIIEAQLAGTRGVTIRGGTFSVGQPRVHPRSGAPLFAPALRMVDVENVSILDATFIGPGSARNARPTPYGEGYGLRAVGGRQVEVANSRFEGFATGIAATRLEGFRLVGNTFSGMRSDGMAVSLSHNGLIERNACDATRVRSKEHPDCIQLWSRPDAAPTSDVVIRGNRIRGSTQGIGLHNHVRNGVDDGGFDRITIEDNDIRVSRSNGISLHNARDSTIRNNRISTPAGGDRQARILTSGGSVKICGNSVEAAAGKRGRADKPC